MKGFIAFIVGLLFAIGLGYSGMTQTHIVKGFLDISGQWMPNLIGVMVGAILVHAIVFQIIKKKSSPLLDTKFYWPVSKKIDKKLLLGAAIFGLGWGWAGICPGPGIVSLASFKPEFLIFIVCMLAGMLMFQWFEKRKPSN